MRKTPSTSNVQNNSAEKNVWMYIQFDKANILDK